MAEQAIEKLKSLGNLKVLAKPGEKAGAITGVVAGPLIWLCALEAKFALVPYACWSGSPSLLHIVAIAAAVLVIAAGFLSWRTWRLAGTGDSRDTDSTADRNRFLALLGLGMSGLSLLAFGTRETFLASADGLAIIAPEIANIMLNPCQ